ncbi:hypothetical protein C8J57DRAFT_1487499 [Mycena rebaudengoi]|nr:hypothetical protein C8J57DRAFT_1487499 [Mycena rebaudengoi]
MSDTVAALRKRIGELASSIALQRKVPDDLERSRADTQRHPPQSNCPLAPRNIIQHLPTLPPRGEYYRLRSTASLHALSTPALWATIHVDFPRARGFDQLFYSYLTHSRSRMLSVTFSGEPGKNISRALCQHADRVVYKLELLEFPTCRDDLLPLALFSGLKVLTLDVQVYDSGKAGSFRIASLLAMLRDAPGIVVCILDNLYMDDDDDPHQKEPLVLLSLQYLALGGGSSNYCSAFMVEYLSLPALRNLVISALDIDMTHLISFFTQSESPLRSLSINSRDIPWNPHEAAQLFGLMPTLADLSLIELVISDVTTVLELLSYSPQRFLLPQLRGLNLTFVSLARSDFDLLCTALSARRSQIKTFRCVLSHSAPAPDADVLDKLRALAAEYGMEIHIGHGPGPNYSVGVCLRSEAYKYLLNTTLALARTSGPLYNSIPLKIKNPPAYIAHPLTGLTSIVVSMFTGNNRGSSPVSIASIAVSDPRVHGDSCQRTTFVLESAPFSRSKSTRSRRTETDASATTPRATRAGSGLGSGAHRVRASRYRAAGGPGILAPRPARGAEHHEAAHGGGTSVESVRSVWGLCTLHLRGACSGDTRTGRGTRSPRLGLRGRVRVCG